MHYIDMVWFSFLFHPLVLMPSQMCFLVYLYEILLVQELTLGTSILSFDPLLLCPLGGPDHQTQDGRNFPTNPHLILKDSGEIIGG